MRFIPRGLQAPLKLIKIHSACATAVPGAAPTAGQEVDTEVLSD